MKNKYLTITLFILSIFLIIGISYAYFEITVSGNDNSKDMVVTAGTLELTFNDKDSVITLNNAKPGDYYTKTITVKNTGTLDTSYNLVWQELTNEITNDELVIEATCKQLNASNTEEGTCNPLSETPVKSSKIIKNVSLQPSYTHEYTIKVTFKEMNKSQNYNTNKTFKGKLGIEEYQKLNFSTDSWSDIAKNVKEGNGSDYTIGDTKTIKMGTYGTHTVRLSNTSTPSECETTDFSETACGFVVEFADIITTHVMNPDTDAKPSGSNIGGYPSSELYTFLTNDIYNTLPSEIQDIIIDTKVISSHGSNDTENFISTDKLYLLSLKEIYSNWDRTEDTSKDQTRQLDYYKINNVATTNSELAKKKYKNRISYWWMRTANSDSSNTFYYIGPNDSWISNNSSIALGISPAFRIG